MAKKKKYKSTTERHDKVHKSHKIVFYKIILFVITAFMGAIIGSIATTTIGPNIAIRPEKKRFTKPVNERLFKDYSQVWRIDAEVPLVNYSIIPGRIAKIEIIPEDIGCLYLEVKAFCDDKKLIFFYIPTNITILLEGTLKIENDLNRLKNYPKIYSKYKIILYDNTGKKIQGGIRMTFNLNQDQNILDLKMMLQDTKIF